MRLNKETQELLLAALEKQPDRLPVIRTWPSTGMSQVHVLVLSRLLEMEREPKGRSQGGT